MTVDIAKLRALLSAASPATWERVDPDGHPTAKVGYCIVGGGIERSHIAAEWRGDAALIVALRNDARELIIELEHLRADHAACTCRREREEAAARARWGTYRDNRVACPHEWEPHVWERGTFWCPLCSLTVSAEERTAMAKERP